MTDQAAPLRARAAMRSSEVQIGAAETPCIVVGSGKGGVGKSVAAVAFATAFAASGRRTLLVDGNQNLGNLHVLLAVRPQLTLEAVVQGEAEPADLVTPVADNLWLLPAASGDAMLHGLNATDRARLHRRVSALYGDYDVVVVDAAAGLESAMRCAAMRATRLVVITIPEPTALTDAYALIKIVTSQVPDLPVDILVNRVTEPTEGRGAFDRLAAAADRFLHREINYLGAVPEDNGMRNEVRDPQRLMDVSSANHALATLRAMATMGLAVPRDMAQAEASA